MSSVDQRRVFDDGLLELDQGFQHFAFLDLSGRALIGHIIPEIDIQLDVLGGDGRTRGDRDLLERVARVEAVESGRHGLYLEAHLDHRDTGRCRRNGRRNRDVVDLERISGESQ